MEKKDYNSILIGIFSQLSALSAHVYAIEELLINKKLITEKNLEDKIKEFAKQVQSEEDTFSGDINIKNRVIH